MATIASYLPESQIITLSKDFPALTDPDDLVGFINPKQFGGFFHEWIHFFHNVSTISGFSLFCVQITLWSNFRWAMDNQDVCIGSNGMEPENIEANKNFLNYINSCRRFNLIDLPWDAKINDLSFEDIKMQETKSVNDNVFSTALIKCSIIYRETKYELEIGVLEILESVAFMLECRCIKKMKDQPLDAPVYPYHVVKGLAGKMSPSLSEDDIICCMLASLQCNTPPHALFNFLKEIELLDANCRYEKLVSYVRQQLSVQNDCIDKTFSQIYSMFQVDEPMGDFIKMTLNRMKKNLDFRKEKPFVELDIINEVSVNAEYMNDVIRQFGGCTIIQKRHQDNERPQCDVMYDFVLPENNESILFGSKMLRACFHFISLHYKSSGEIIKTESVDIKSGKTKCPFYTVCGSSVRVNYSNFCAESPWRTMTIKGNGNCYYAKAMKATNPPVELDSNKGSHR